MPCLEQLSAKVSVKNIEYSQVDRDIFRQSVEALFAGNSLDIVYHSPHTNTTTARTIHPLHLMHYMGSWHLIAWCGIKKELRNFALSRIRTTNPATENLTFPDNLTRLEGIHQATLRYHAGQHHNRSRPALFPENCPVGERTDLASAATSSVSLDGSLTLHFPVADFRELMKTILSHGADIEVLGPPELKMLGQRRNRQDDKNILSV